jgi:hypothetical protein
LRQALTIKSFRLAWQFFSRSNGPSMPSVDSSVFLSSRRASMG